MTVDVNLLPEEYRRALKRDRWLRRGATVGIVLLMMEMLAGCMLYVRAGNERNLAASIAERREATDTLKREVSTLSQQAAIVRKNLRLAEQLRATHHWSRLLAALADATPDGVILVGISTDPTRWSAPRGDPRAKRLLRPQPGKPAAKDTPPPEPPVKALAVQGHAADHEMLSKLMTQLHESGLFAAIDLERMERGQLDQQNAVSFELRGRW